MMRYKCVVSYEGAAYCGWQTQKHGDSVQEQIEAVLSRIMNETITIYGSGRTDAGVNALGQVFHFDAEKMIPERKLYGAMNAFLPKDIYIRSVKHVSERFHSRFCVRSKRYDYSINMGEYDVFSRNHAYQYPYQLDVEKMQKAALYLIGTHDFTSFNSNSLKDTPDQVRTIYSIDFIRDENMLTISYFGRGFLRYMVRMMTAQLIEVGRGHIKPERIKEILDAKSKTIANKNAPPCGLSLIEVNHFEVVAEDENYLVREFLPEDQLPNGEDLSDLEKAVRSSRLPRKYAFADRHSQMIFGVYQIDLGGGCLILKEQCKCEKILSQLIEYQLEQTSSASIKMIIR